MAQRADVLDVHAKYGESQARPGYELLRLVSHWSMEDIEREQQIAQGIGNVQATITCSEKFSEILTLFPSTRQE